MIRSYEDDAVPNAAAFFSEAHAGVVDENLAHGSRDRSEKMSLIVMSLWTAQRETDERLMNDLRGLQGVIGPLAEEKVRRNAAQFLVDLFHPFRWIFRDSSVAAQAASWKEVCTDSHEISPVDFQFVGRSIRASSLNAKMTSERAG